MPAKASGPVEALPRQTTGFGAMGPSYKGMRPAYNGALGGEFVGACHARESVGSGWGISLHRPLSGPWAPPTTARWVVNL